jgi:hypothetical protein
MFQHVSTGIRLRSLATTRLLCFGLLTLGAVSACEDKGLGRSCSLNFDAGPTQGAYTWQAADCPSHICNRPAVQAGLVASDVDTGPYCTVTCNSDSDCGGETRNFNNPSDKRCKTGYVCAIPYDRDKLCCQKLCLCRDFFVVSTGPATPAACQNGAASCL